MELVRSKMLIFVLCLGGLALVAKNASAHGGQKAVKPQLRKFVTQGADFVLYLPQGWTAVEKADGNRLALTVGDPDGLFIAEVDYGTGGGDRGGQTSRLIDRLVKKCPGLKLANAMRSADLGRVVFDGFYNDPQKGAREFRCWVTSGGGDSMVSRIEGPAGRLAENRETLLSVLSNVRLIKGAFAAGVGLKPQPLSPYQLRDGSASFSIPRGWRVQDLGKAQFIAVDPTGRFSFMVAKAEMVSPQMGLSAPGLLVLPYMTPHEAFQKLCAKLGIAENMNFLQVERHKDMERSAGQIFTAGTTGIESFLYTCVGRIGPSKGFTFGMCFYSRVGTWSLNHFSVAGPEAEFDAFSAGFADMLQSYRINQSWVGDYIRQGLSNLRRLQQETSRVVARDAREIRDMMQAAYA